jgi:phage-related protein
MKPVRFVGSALADLRLFPPAARHDAGYQLEKLQRGEQPNDGKPMPTVGRGVEEYRIWDKTGTFRVIYTARHRGVVYVLHAFQKKTAETAKRDIDLARTRLAQVLKE